MSLKNAIGVGIAGNFTNHLEQAGEDSDFAHIKCENENAPKGIFPFYVPSTQAGFLNTFPISFTQIDINHDDLLQAEPECAIICDLIYENSKIIAIYPTQFGAFNDCSIRRAGIKKISEKKNWGSHSKGFATNLLDIDSFDEFGIMNRYNITSFLRRNNELCEYGIDSPIKDYSYFYNTLLNWLIDQFNDQLDNGPLEDMHKLLIMGNYPKQAIVSIGATRYTPFAENDRLQKEDEIFVVLYPNDKYDHHEIRTMVEHNMSIPHDISFLRQVVKGR